nr:hypothetical protein [Streptomyces sp. NRRL F-5053]
MPLAAEAAESRIRKGVERLGDTTVLGRVAVVAEALAGDECGGEQLRFLARLGSGESDGGVSDDTTVEDHVVPLRTPRPRRRRVVQKQHVAHDERNTAGLFEPFAVRRVVDNFAGLRSAADELPCFPVARQDEENLAAYVADQQQAADATVARGPLVGVSVHSEPPVIVMMVVMHGGASAR